MIRLPLKNYPEVIYSTEEERQLIRPCYVYEDEYKNCDSFRNRFHQSFIYGNEYILDCSGWNKDYLNCEKWRKFKDPKALEELLVSEQNRQEARLLGHKRNDVWKKRDKPPENWNAPLPEYLQQNYAKSFLEIKAQEIRDGNTALLDPKKPLCTIL